MRFLLVAVLLVGANAVNPGLKVLLTQRGIDYANSIGANVIQKEVKSINLPDQSGSAHHVHYQLQHLALTSFSLGNTNLGLESGSGLKWTANSVEIEIKGQFRYKFRKFFIKISDHGSITIKVHGISIGLGLVLGVDGNGKPSIRPGQCSCSIHKVDVKFHGGRAFIYNLFRGKVGSVVKGQLQNQLCVIIKSLVEKKAEASLSKLNVKYDVNGYNLILDFGLVSAPTASNHDLQFDLKGRAEWKGDHAPIPFSPPVLKSSADETKMTTVVMSDYLFNTVAYQAYRHGLLLRNITSKDLPNGDLLNTTCSGMCIGKLIPQISKAFPNSKVEVELKANQRPTISLNSGTVSVNGDAIINFFARKSDGSSHYLFRIDAIGTATFTPTLKNSTIHGKVDNLSFRVNVTDSAIGQINSGTLQLLADLAVSTTLRPMLDKYGAKGMSLPTTVDGFKILQPSMKLLQNEIVVSANIEMTSAAADNSVFES